MDFKNVNWKNKKVWAAFIAGGLVIAQGIQLLTQEQVSAVQVAANGVFGLLIALGILTNPEN